MSNTTGMEIAIIGMSGRFPGAGNIKEYWANLRNGVESVFSLTDEEILEEGEDRIELEDPLYVKASAFIKDKEFFDAAFFGYRPEEARVMNPQTRLFHECCWNAMEDAGYDVNHNQ